MDSECRITGIKQSSSTSKQMIETREKFSNEHDWKETEKHVARRRNLSEVTKREMKDIQEDISGQVDSILG